jgi:methionyl-tRNA formyltransferase
VTPLVYLGTPDMAVPPLRGLVAAGFPIELVVTRADARRGRGSRTSPSAVKQAALELGLPVAHDVDAVLATRAELGVVVAYGRLIRPHVLERLPMVNLHFSLLPRWRGAAPVERAILAGDTITGVCVMAMEEGLDTGGVYASTEVPIGPDTTAVELRTQLVATGTDLLVSTLSAGLGTAVPQTGDTTYAAKLGRDDVVIHWDRPPVEVYRQIRIGGAVTTFRGAQLKIHAARLVGDQPGDELRGDIVGGIRLLEVQPEGKRVMSVADWANGVRPQPGERLG